MLGYDVVPEFMERHVVQLATTMPIARRRYVRRTSLREGITTMKASILGFWLEPASAITLGDLFQRLKAKKGKAEKFRGYDRLIFVDETDTYHIGLLLTSKNYKRFCELHKQGETLSINVRQVQEGASLIDFNFFVVNKETGRGLYQYYHNSCRCPMFGNYCIEEFDQIRQERKAAAITAAGGSKAPDHQLTMISRKYEGTLSWGILVRPEKFDDLVRKFDAIHNFDFELNSITAEKEQRYRLLQGVAARIRHQVGFERKVSVKDRAAAILKFVRGQNDLGDLSVAGRGVDGLERTIELYDNPDSFGSYEFDSLAQNMDFEPKDFAKSVFMSEIIRVADAHEHILKPKAK
jgi:hypothetical protein